MVFLPTASVLLSLLVTGVLPSHLPPSRQRSASEPDVKAAFLYNFTRFVSWPAGIPPGTEPFRVCVIADAETTAAVERTMAGETVHGRPAETRVPTTPRQIKSCQMLFVGRSAEERAGPMLAAARESPVLIVGDGETFPKRGGAIGFVLEDGRLRFDIAPRNAQRTGLTISSRLLGVARRTDPDK